MSPLATTIYQFEEHLLDKIKCLAYVVEYCDCLFEEFSASNSTRNVLYDEILLFAHHDSYPNSLSRSPMKLSSGGHRIMKPTYI